MTLELPETLVDVLDHAARDGVVITFVHGGADEEQISAEQLRRRAGQWLHQFQKAGIGQGDELVLFLRDNARFLEAFWGCLMGGIVPIPVAVGIADQHRVKLLKILSTLKRPALLTDSDADRLLKRGASESEHGSVLDTIADRWMNLDDMVGKVVGDTTRADPVPRKGGDMAFIQFSSGSTGAPKGVMLTHTNLIYTTSDMSEGLDCTPEDRSFSWMPLTHDMGLIGFHLMPMLTRMSHAIMDTDVFSRRPLIWLEKAAQYKATLICSPNFGLRHYLNSFGRRDHEGLDLGTVRVLLNGAEPISVALCREFNETLAPFGLSETAMTTAYGLAEASLSVASAPHWEPLDSVAVEPTSLGYRSAVEYRDDGILLALHGTAVANCDLRVATREGEPLPEDIVGELQISGPNVTSGYYGNEAATAEVFAPDGWLRTGDLGFFHDGNLVIAGRDKDLIISNGQNIHPHDLELLATECEGIMLGNVIAAGARKPDAEGDDIVMFIKHRGDIEAFAPTAKTVRALVYAKAGINITHVLPIRAIPRTTSGKMMRHACAEEYLSGAHDYAIAKLAPTIGAGGEPEADKNSTAAILHAILTKIIGDRELGLDDDFFDAGISSPELSQAFQMIDERFPGVIDITDMIDISTINELAQFIDSGGNLAE